MVLAGARKIVGNAGLAHRLPVAPDGATEQQPRQIGRNQFISCSAERGYEQSPIHCCRGEARFGPSSASMHSPTASTSASRDASTAASLRAPWLACLMLVLGESARTRNGRQQSNSGRVRSCELQLRYILSNAAECKSVVMPISSRDSGGQSGFTPIRCLSLFIRGNATMKTCMFAMLALSVLIGIATPTGAFDTKTRHAVLVAS